MNLQPHQKRLSLLVCLIALFAFFTPPSSARACEQCPDDYEITIKDAAQKAHLIAIISLAPEAAQPPQNKRLPAGEPDSIAVDVHQVFKGKLEGAFAKDQRIIANSWDGMCNYGVIIKANDARQFLVLLTWNGTEYRQVHQGCAPYQLPVSAGGVAIPSGKGKQGSRDAPSEAQMTPLSELAESLGVAPQP